MKTVTARLMQPIKSTLQHSSLWKKKGWILVMS